MAPEESADQVWLPVIARALSILSMHLAGMDDKAMVEKAKFLEGLGLKRSVVAEMLSTTAASITEQYRQAKRRRGAKQRARKKTSGKAP